MGLQPGKSSRPAPWIRYTLLPATSQVTLLGKVLLPAQLAQLFEAALTAFNAVTDAKAAKLTKKVHGTDKGKRQKLAITPGGKGGLVYVEPDGKQVPGLTRGPVAPADKTPSGSGNQGP